jgi:hypothetical protein
MKRIFISFALLAIANFPAYALAQQNTPQQKTGESMEMKHSGRPDSPQWRQLSSLVGQWQGDAMEGGMNHGVTLEVRMTGDGSAIMQLLGTDTPMEMLTVFHADGPVLLATHYCAAHNQPRMQMIPTSGLNRIEFRFKDGTNIGADDGHMVGLIVTFIDADHHDETWIYQDKGKELPGTVFHYSRKK